MWSYLKDLKELSDGQPHTCELLEMHIIVIVIY